MPKMKVHKGTAKRFRVTKNGKVMRRRASKSHLLEKKSAKRKRGYAVMEQVSDHDKKAIKRQLGV